MLLWLDMHHFFFLFKIGNLYGVMCTYCNLQLLDKFRAYVCSKSATQIYLSALMLKICVSSTDICDALQPSYMFTDKEHRGTFEYSEDLTNLTVGTEAPETVISAQRYQENDNDLLLSTSDKEDNGTRTSNGSYTSTYNAPSDLLSLQTPAETALINHGGSSYPSQTNFSLDDLLGLGVPDAPAPPPPPALTLNSKPVLDPGTFQKKWSQLALSFSQVCCFQVSLHFLITGSAKYSCDLLPLCGEVSCDFSEVICWMKILHAAIV
jgi:hypothetical protein